MGITVSRVDAPHQVPVREIDNGVGDSSTTPTTLPGESSSSDCRGESTFADSSSESFYTDVPAGKLDANFSSGGLAEADVTGVEEAVMAVVEPNVMQTLLNVEHPGCEEEMDMKRRMLTISVTEPCGMYGSKGNGHSEPCRWEAGQGPAQLKKVGRGESVRGADAQISQLAGKATAGVVDVLLKTCNRSVAERCEAQLKKVGRGQNVRGADALRMELTGKATAGVVDVPLESCGRIEFVAQTTFLSDDVQDEECVHVLIGGVPGEVPACVDEFLKVAGVATKEEVYVNRILLVKSYIPEETCEPQRGPPKHLKLCRCQRPRRGRLKDMDRRATPAGWSSTFGSD